MMYANVNANDSAKPKRYKPETGGILPQMADVVEWIATADNRATWTFETSTRKGEGVFSESRKKGLPTIANPVYGYSAPAKSGAGIGVPEMIKATHDAPSVFFCAVNPTHAFFSDAGIIIRAAHEIMVGWMGASTEAPVSLIAGYANPVQSTTSKIGVFGGGFKTLIKEAAAMLATTPTQNPQFIWLIAAVRRDMPTSTAKIHHIAAETEKEARRSLA
ncbi:TPA: host cell division inhibitor Icd-like protein, partial [Salmonella enterica subsp. enterica serovar Agona]